MTIIITIMVFIKKHNKKINDINFRACLRLSNDFT